MGRGRRTLVGVGIGLGVLAGAGLAIAGVGLGLAHRDIRSLDPPLPEPTELRAPTADPDLPVRLRWIDTASQAMPRSAVLEPDLDPTPDEPYVMAHTAFVLEWADGRLLLVDLGMDRESARAFGRPMELVAGASPAEPHGDVAEQLGGDVGRVEGVAFTHLHTDHTAGALPLCAARAPGARRIPLFQTGLQAERANYTTRAGHAQLEAADCLERRILAGGPAFEVPGFPGLLVIPVAGHTPGSQVFVAHVRASDAPGAPARRYVLTGDVVNHEDGVRLELPKPRLYSLLVVPEATGRLARVRRYLRELVERHGMTPLVSHDRRQLEGSGVQAWTRGGAP